MTAVPDTTWPVAALALLAAGATLLVLRRLRGRRGPGLRAKLVSLFVGLVAVELAALPLLLTAFFGDELFGLAETGAGAWLAGLAYGALTLLAIARLFPWQEVEAIADRPDARLRDLLDALRRPED